MAPEVAPTNPPPSESEDVQTSRTRVVPQSENFQVPPEAPPTLAYEGSSFDEVAREALRAAEGIIREVDPLAAPNPPPALMEDPLLGIEDFLVEEHVDLALLWPGTPRSRLHQLRDRPKRHTRFPSSSMMVSRHFLQNRNVRNKTKIQVLTSFSLQMTFSVSLDPCQLRGTRFNSQLSPSLSPGTGPREKKWKVLFLRELLP